MLIKLKFILIFLVIIIGITSCCQHSGYLYKFTLSSDKEIYNVSDTVKLTGIIQNIGENTFSYINSNKNLYNWPYEMWLLEIYDSQQKYYNSYNMGEIFGAFFYWRDYTELYPSEYFKFYSAIYLPDITWKFDPTGKFKISIVYKDYQLKRCNSIDTMRSNVVEIEFIK